MKGSGFHPRGGLLTMGKNGKVVRLDSQKPNKREVYFGKLLHGVMSMHPCIGARTLASSGGAYFSLFSSMSSVASAYLFLRDLKDYLDATDTLDSEMKTFAAIFVEDEIGSQIQFEELYWEAIQNMHDIDCLVHDWDQAVSSDVTSNDFELSLCGRAIFTTTLNPMNARLARRSAFPIWICNQVKQFELLRKKNRFADWQQAIRNWDAEFDPSSTANPVLQDHGVASSAPQLAGSNFLPCPLTVRVGHSEKLIAARKVLTVATDDEEPDHVLDGIQRRIINCEQTGSDQPVTTLESKLEGAN